MCFTSVVIFGNGEHLYQFYSYVRYGHTLIYFLKFGRIQSFFLEKITIYLQILVQPTNGCTYISEKFFNKCGAKIQDTYINKISERYCYHFTTHAFSERRNGTDSSFYGIYRNLTKRMRTKYESELLKTL